MVDALKKEGLTKKDIGREEFLERAWAWKDEYGGRIVAPAAQDWAFPATGQRERFTMDEGCFPAPFAKRSCNLYEKGLIYRGDRIINWCPDCQTALSDAEVEYEEQHGASWHIRYTTSGRRRRASSLRPRARKRCWAIPACAVNPEDERYTSI